MNPLTAPCEALLSLVWLWSNFVTGVVVEIAVQIAVQFLNLENVTFATSHSLSATEIHL